MKNKMFGERSIKRLFLEELNEKPSVAQSAIDSLNNLLYDMAKKVLVKANDYRKAKSPSKRLTSSEIDIAYKDFLLNEKGG